ncbi:AimR family lysis-lysogeny pheromone receptor [Alkalihalobacillus sp. BA299]|uniref:AimR family lysis-lysogeny pheromone receptor n=1 Tax=Alkalihalobacillus sp. BA299 TaxID=2815938 RepID=UPI001AD982FA|nr:AimR family lysis-lysogeny pheromone receptor [Alkalihalobacillus sp. BA299]
MLKQMIKNELEKEKVLAIKLISITGLKSKSSLYKFLNEPDREMDHFEGLLKMVRYLFPKQEFEIMDAYFRNVNPNGKTARISLEYATINRLNDLKVFMLGKLKMCSNAESKEWAKTYEIDQQVMDGQISPTEANILLNDLKLKTIEMKVIAKVFMIYNYYDLKMLDRCQQVASLIEDGLSQLKKYPYLKKSLVCRIGLINMHIGNREEGILSGEMVINNAVSQLTEATANQVLGILSIIESYEVAYNYLSKALNIYNELQSLKIRGTQRTINFLQNYWKREPEYLDFKSKEIDDRHEIAFYYIQKQQFVKAKDILHEIECEIDEMPHIIKGFHYFYRGLISGRREDFFESVIQFKYANQKMYYHFPLLELKKLGEDELTLKVLEI